MLNLRFYSNSMSNGFSVTMKPRNCLRTLFNWFLCRLTFVQLDCDAQKKNFLFCKTLMILSSLLLLFHYELFDNFLLKRRSSSNSIELAALAHQAKRLSVKIGSCKCAVRVCAWVYVFACVWVYAFRIHKNIRFTRCMASGHTKISFVRSRATRTLCACIARYIFNGRMAKNFKRISLPSWNMHSRATFDSNLRCKKRHQTFFGCIRTKDHLTSSITKK